MNEPEDIDARLARLARATDGLHASPGFTERVFAAVDASFQPSWQFGVVRFGRTMLAVGAVSAVLALVAAYSGASSDDSALAMTYGMEEVEW